MKKEKEKIRYSVVMNNALKISLIMTFLIYVAIIVFYNFNTSNSCMNNIYNTLNNEEAQAHNGKIQANFGNNVSAKDVRIILQEISSNNAKADSTGELSTIYVIFKSSNSDTTTYDVSVTSNINSVKKQIKSGYTYKVESANQELSDNNIAEEVGYYTNGFLKCIRITQNNKSS